MNPLELCPRVGGAPPARIWSVPARPCSVVLLGPVIGHWLHYIRKRTLPCPPSDCPYCRRKVPARWQGYAAGAEKVVKLIDTKQVGTWQRIVIPISPELDELLASAGTPPLILQCAPRKSAKGFEVRKIEPLLRDDGLPLLFDVRLVLYRVFGIRPPSAEPQTPEKGEQSNE